MTDRIEPGAFASQDGKRIPIKDRPNGKTIGYGTIRYDRDADELTVEGTVFDDPPPELTAGTLRGASIDLAANEAILIAGACANHPDRQAVGTQRMPSVTKGPDGEYRKDIPLCEPCLENVRKLTGGTS